MFRFVSIELKKGKIEMTRLELKEMHSGLPQAVLPQGEVNSPKKSAQQGTEAEETLIRAVHRRRPLWDPTVHFYRNNSVVKLLWDEVSLETGLSDAQARTRWKSLRDYYRIELKKVKRGETDGKKSYWAYFQLMSFLGDILVYSKTPNEHHNNSDIGKSFSTDHERTCEGSNLNSVSSHDDIHQQAPIKVEDNHLAENPVKEHPPILKDHDYLGKPKEQLIDSTSQNCESSSFSRTRNTLKMRPNFDEMHRKVLIQLESRRIDLLEKAAKQEEDDDLLFFKSLLPLVKSLPSSRKMRIRLNIQEIICNEIEKLSSN